MDLHESLSLPQACFAHLHIATPQSPAPRQAWPGDLPLINAEAAANGTSADRLNMGVIMYSCSFAVILLMILSQVKGRTPEILVLFRCRWRMNRPQGQEATAYPWSS